MVKSGTATLFDGDDPTCATRTVKTNGWFTDPGGSHVHLVRNDGIVDLVLAAFQVVPADATRRQDIPVGDPRIPPCGFWSDGTPGVAGAMRQIRLRALLALAETLIRLTAEDL